MINEGYQETFDKVKQGMLGNVSKLIKKYKNPDAIIYGKARKEAKKVQDMENTDKLKEAVKAALMNPEKADLNKDNKLSSYEKKRGAAIEKAMQKEDLDLGHEDNEPHMLKADLYKIGKYAMELYQMVDQFEGQGEVDFPAWWQSKITNAASMISSAKHYLEFELKEPEIDAIVGAVEEIKEVVNYSPEGKDKIYSLISQALQQGKLTKDTQAVLMKWAADPNSTKEAIIEFLKSIIRGGNVKDEQGLEETLLERVFNRIKNDQSRTKR